MHADTYLGALVLSIHTHTPLALSHCQGACGEGDAGHRAEPQARVALVGHPVLLQQRLNHRPLLGCHRPDNDVLVAREPEIARVHLRKEVVIACACFCC